MSEYSKDTILESIETMLHPRSIAIIGATSRLQYGGRFLNNLIETGYTGRIFPINPKYEELMGVRCYPSIMSLPEVPDLAAIIVPFEKIADVLAECGDRGIKTGIIITAGFAEKGTDDRKLAQESLKEFCAQTGMRLCGPNCLGIANVTDNIWTCSTGLSSVKTAVAGDLALVSQSGACAFGPFFARAQDRGLGFSYIISTGNEVDLDTTDFIRYCINTPETKAVVAYFESIKDSDKFRRVAEEALHLGKPIVAIKVGRSLAGQQAALSHTASMTGSDQAYDALFKQVGVIRVEDWDELLEIGSFLANSPPFKKETIGIVAHSGGVASQLADKCEQVIGVPQPSVNTRVGLESILGEFGSSANPADITWHAFNEDLTNIINLMLSDTSFGGVVLGTAGSDDQARHIIDMVERSTKPFLMLWTGSERAVEGLQLLRNNKVQVFYRADNISKAIKASLEYHKTRKKLSDKNSVKVEIERVPSNSVLMNNSGALGLFDSLELLSDNGIKIAKCSLAHSPQEAIQLAMTIGYPVVLKVDSTDLPHKTDFGLIKANLNTDADVENAYIEIHSKINEIGKKASVNGILVQEMVRYGIEVILGVKQDPQLGPVLLFGIGGVMTELLKDFSLRVCPVQRTDVQEMVREVKGFPLLTGFRGWKPADIDALEDAIMNLSHFALTWKESLRELDINPLIVLPKGSGVLAVDAFIVNK